MQLPQLDDIHIASPCPMDWDEMVGDDRTRFCDMCTLHVYNIAGMTRDDAEALIRNAEGGRLCIRMYKRADGTVLTRDCPVGLRAIRQTMVRGVARVAALLLFFVSGAWALVSRNNNDNDDFYSNTSDSERIADLQPFRSIRSWLTGSAPSGQTCFMGLIAPLPATPPTGVGGGGVTGQTTAGNE